MSNTSSFKDNLIAGIVIFTFVIPVIPVGLYYGYQYLFSSEKSSSTTQSITPTTQESDQSDTSSEQQTFGGYSCSYDCSGHEAGYEWAQDNDVCDEYYDGGNSESFAEGVRSYAEDNCSSEYENEDEDYYDPY